MAIGDGSLKPLHRTYGACQYRSSELKSIALFFVVYVFVYNFGSMSSRVVSPILRQDVQCFGNNDCFTLAFGISGICMIFAALLSIIANRYSEFTQADGFGLLNVFACIWVCNTHFLFFLFEMMFIGFRYWFVSIARDHNEN